MPKTSIEKMKNYRKRLRDAGLRPLQIWVPDVRATGFAEKARQQSLIVSGRESEREALDFIESIFDADDVK